MKYNMWGVEEPIEKEDITNKDVDELWTLINQDSLLSNLLGSDRDKFYKEVNKRFIYTEKQMKHIWIMKSSLEQRI